MIFSPPLDIYVSPILIYLVFLQGGGIIIEVIVIQFDLTSFDQVNPPTQATQRSERNQTHD